jgi:UDP-N-acetylmuramate: L-alanyl-gamma-D-glutamyl-meso-diaminopimelate ligase
VRVTLQALRLRFGGRRIWAIFEPRSNSSRRRIFQDAFAESFDAADITVIANPYDASGIPEDERMSPTALVNGIRKRGNEAFNWPNADAICQRLTANVQPEDVIVILSNGSFDGIHAKIITTLEARLSRG